MTIIIFDTNPERREQTSSLIEKWKTDHEGLICDDDFRNHNVIATGCILSLTIIAQQEKPALIIAELNKDLHKIIAASKQTCLAIISGLPRPSTGQDPEAEIQALTSINQSKVLACDFLYEGSSPSIWRARLGKLLFKTSSLPCEKITIGETVVDKDQSRVSVKGTPIILRSKELDVLWALAVRPGILFTRPQIIDTVYGCGFSISDRAIDTTIKNVRIKLNELRLNASSAIKTVRGMGYKASEDHLDWCAPS